jgi:hypothetical protein
MIATFAFPVTPSDFGRKVLARLIHVLHKHVFVATGGTFVAACLGLVSFQSEHRARQKNGFSRLHKVRKLHAGSFSATNEHEFSRMMRSYGYHREAQISFFN